MRWLAYISRFKMNEIPRIENKGFKSSEFWFLVAYCAAEFLNYALNNGEPLVPEAVMNRILFIVSLYAGVRQIPKMIMAQLRFPPGGNKDAG